MSVLSFTKTGRKRLVENQGLLSAQKMNLMSLMTFDSRNQTKASALKACRNHMTKRQVSLVRASILIREHEGQIESDVSATCMPRGL